MTDVTPNEARMPEDAAVTVTSADTLRAMASPIRMRILGTLRVNGEQTVGSISEPTSVFWTGCRNCLGNGLIHAPAMIMF